MTPTATKTLAPSTLTKPEQARLAVLAVATSLIWKKRPPVVPRQGHEL